MYNTQLGTLWWVRWNHNSAIHIDTKSDTKEVSGILYTICDVGPKLRVRQEVSFFRHTTVPKNVVNAVFLLAAEVTWLHHSDVR